MTHPRFIALFIIIASTISLLSCSANSTNNQSNEDSVKTGYFSGLPLFKECNEESRSGEFKVSKMLTYLNGSYVANTDRVNVQFRYATINKEFCLFDKKSKNGIDTDTLDIRYSGMLSHVTISRFCDSSGTEELQICKMQIRDSGWNMLNRNIELIRTPERGIIYASCNDAIESIRLLDTKSFLEITIPHNSKLHRL